MPPPSLSLIQIYQTIMSAFSVLVYYHEAPIANRANKTIEKLSHGACLWALKTQNLDVGPVANCVVLFLLCWSVAHLNLCALIDVVSKV